VQNEREWERLARDVLDRPDWLERPEFRGNAQRIANRERLDGEVSAAFLALPRAELEARLRRHQIAWGAINTTAGVARHPQYRRMAVESPAGRFDVPASPVRWRGYEPRPGPVPALGQHGAALRAEFAAEEP